MRFSHFLKYNAVPEWQNHYMDYNELKNLIYTLQTDELKLSDTGNAVEEEEVSGSKDFFSKKIRNKFLSGSSNKNKNSKTKNDDLANEETIELEDLNTSTNVTTTNNNNNNENNHGNSRSNSNNKKTSNFKKVFKDKLFDNSRRSSASSEGRTLFNTYEAFVANLTQEKLKVDDFYKRLESRFFEKFDTLIKDLEKEGIILTHQRSFESATDDLSINNINNQKQLSVIRTNELESRNDFYSEDDIDEDIDDEEFEPQDNTALLNYSQFNIKSQKKSLLKQSIINLYIDLCQLKSFIELNKIGFTKITKKADKVLHLNTRNELIESEEFFKDTYIFQNEILALLNTKISQLVESYAIITNNNASIETSKLELKQFLHDHIVWERSNSWKDMLGLSSYTNQDEDNGKNQEKNSKLLLEFYEFPLPIKIDIKRPKIQINNLLVPKLFFTRKAFKIAFIFVVTAILLGIKTFNDPAQHRCMALVECVAFLWASEALPLFVTALLVPLLTVLFKVLKNSDGSIMDAATASSTIFASMWSSTIMILLAGFTLSEGLSQYDIAKVLASWLLSFAGIKPRNVLLMAMGVVFFLSMWISNVAAPVLTYSLMKPLLDQLDANNPFGKALVLGVALSANIAGFSSPISSPQNIISMQYLKEYGIGWGQFFAVALPAGILSLFLVWGLMCLTFKINTTKIERFVPIKTRFTLKQYYVIFVTLGTIILWCVEAQIEGAFGSSGQIAVLPMALLFGTGLLSTGTLNTFPWSIVVLAMGGIALGKAVSSSGLLATIAGALQRRIEHDSAMAVLCIFGVLMLVVGTFVSHTVSAIIIIPLVQQIGEKLSGAKSAPILVFGCTLLASAGMGLASSGFPNITAISTLDRYGNPYLDMMTFISRGVPASLIVFVCVITLGYGIMASVLSPYSGS
ncbi:hypothetical protein Kpol_2001p55 [Vanderwaltozyma polyspora DSM 70294]|uniref:SPX domain-containing protein n=1 Tax=Vanderwaltozyma polyspora (strain ATCC 22028 / DSM 70294 / BCRC 21397 / CBS 2163 / NBRC 10782 / NRRL Y-8283 / UCD 57-17) TaxID=436907 RepID=A7TGT7_VANPO|nr:uncharacterized protein Kpol_2001p55 [Vanderwaltozyma polyspora DSM 70294]EDO18550.1 hypothetical protein Kpol_2001p55 [Vanderwaltozyma polyspora DSM 70294]